MFIFLWRLKSRHHRMAKSKKDKQASASRLAERKRERQLVKKSIGESAVYRLVCSGVCPSVCPLRVRWCALLRVRWCALKPTCSAANAEEADKGCERQLLAWPNQILRRLLEVSLLPFCPHPVRVHRWICESHQLQWSTCVEPAYGFLCWIRSSWIYLVWAR